MQTESLPIRRPARADNPGYGQGARKARLAAALLVLAVSLGGCGDLLYSEPPVTKAEPKAAMTLPPQALELTQRALDEGRLDDAERMLEQILSIAPENPQGQLLVGELRLARGKPAKALNVFEELKNDPEVAARALQGMGISMMLINSKQLGFENLQRAVELDPSLWRAWNAIGSYYDTKGAWSEAVAAYDAALVERPEDAMIYNNRGFSYFMQGRLEESIDDLKRALQLDPSLAPAKANLRLALAWSGRYVHALAGVADRDMPEVLNNIGYVAMMRGDLENAEAYLLRAMEVDPSFNEKAWRNLAYLRNLKELKAIEPPVSSLLPPETMAETIGE